MGRAWQFLALGLMTALSVCVLALVGKTRALQDDVSALTVRADWPHPGMFVPSVPVTTLSGDSGVLGAPTEGRTQVLYFFDTRCPYCLESLPAWNALTAGLASDSAAAVEVYGVSLHPEDRTRRYVAEHEVAFPVAVLSSRRYRQLCRAWAVPFVLVIDGEGQVQHFVRGSLAGRTLAADSVVRFAKGQLAYSGVGLDPRRLRYPR